MRTKGFLLLICASLLALVSCGKDSSENSKDYFGLYTEKVYSADDFKNEKVAVNEDGLVCVGEDGDFVYCSFLRISDEKQLSFYLADLAQDGSPYANGKEKLYSFNAGGTIGMVSFYGTPAIYPYTLNKSVITIRRGSQTAQFLVVKDGLLYNGLDKWPKVGM
ncbi:MAG: hypothetical protein IJ616_04080 [Bacteroidales bacterium]|jgi:hypothetical protein|nr:hypothetical protein [Bacteroidales bacterium]